VITNAKDAKKIPALKSLFIVWFLYFWIIIIDLFDFTGSRLEIINIVAIRRYDISLNT